MRDARGLVRQVDACLAHPGQGRERREYAAAGVRVPALLGADLGRGYLLLEDLGDALLLPALTATNFEDRYGDVCVDTGKSRQIYEQWKKLTKPAPGPGGLRRPLWMNRPLRPTDAAYALDS